VNGMNGKVLIVDDSLTVRMDLAEAFEAAGIRPLLCSSIREAREAFAAQVVGVVILDVLLPDGDGVEFLREIRAAPATCTVPVLLLSSEADVRDRVRGLWMGANDYLGKPYDAAYVVARAQDVVSRRRNENPKGTLGTRLKGTP
jgi:two-component system NtrC family sensor kinase